MLFPGVLCNGGDTAVNFLRQLYDHVKACADCLNIISWGHIVFEWSV